MKMSEKTINRLTPEQFQQWKEHPVTVFILSTLEEHRQIRMAQLEGLSLSKFLNHSPQELPGLQVEILAKANYCQGLTALVDIHLDDLSDMEAGK